MLAALLIELLDEELMELLDEALVELLDEALMELLDEPLLLEELLDEPVLAVPKTSRCWPTEISAAVSALPTPCASTTVPEPILTVTLCNRKSKAKAPGRNHLAECKVSALPLRAMTVPLISSSFELKRLVPATTLVAVILPVMPEAAGAELIEPELIEPELIEPELMELELMELELMELELAELELMALELIEPELMDMELELIELEPMEPLLPIADAGVIWSVPIAATS